MHEPVWNLEHAQARLHLGSLTCKLDLLRPADGISELRGPASLVGTRLLGLAIPGFIPGHRDSLMEANLRGRELVVAYRESVGWPVRVDSLWRPFVLTDGCGALELVISVRTYAPLCRPSLSVLSTVKAGEVLGWDARSGIQPLHDTQGSWTGLAGTGRLCCLVFRLLGSDLSYLEMLHPADCYRDEWLRNPEPIVPVQFRHRLFPQPLEKGVILRARLRGAFVPRANDAALAEQLAREFADSAPPLGS